MSRNNDVFQVLVSSGNAIILAAGNPVSALAVGQIGFFDEATNLSVVTPVRKFYVAVGVDSTGGSTLDSINTSAGQYIQRTNLVDLSFRPHTASQPMIVEVSDFSAECDTDYAIRLEFRNQQIYRRQGYNQFTHTYSIRTACCEDCVACPSGDANEITELMVADINNDEYGLVTAEPIARQAVTIVTHGTSADYATGDVVSAADITVMKAWNAVQPDETTKVFTDIRLTTNGLAVKNFCNINLGYFNPRETFIIASLVEGFSCTGAVTTTQDIVFEEGLGYDIQQQEYRAGGWNGRPGPYRASTATGLAADGFEYFAVRTTPYDQFWLTYDQESVAGWSENKNNLATLVAIPEADTITRDAFAVALDAIVAGLGFDPLTNDAAAASATSTVVETTSGLDDVTLDGITT